MRICVCFVFRLEKEYTRVKHKEAEDNEELRRLKTENRLLLQRIDELEKVNGYTCQFCVTILLSVLDELINNLSNYMHPALLSFVAIRL